MKTMTVDDPRHGTPRGRYAHVSAGVPLCDPCREAHNTYERRRRKSQSLYGNKWKIDATGSRRRIQALQRLGWRGEDLAAELGNHQSQISYIARGAQLQIRSVTAAAIAALYDRLSMVHGPSEKTRKRAESLGWLPPLAWDDDTIDDPTFRPVRGSHHREKFDLDLVVVERRLAGDHRVRTSYADRQEIVRRCHARGLSDGDAADLTGLSSQTVFRIRRELGLPALFDAAGEPISRGAA